MNYQKFDDIPMIREKKKLNIGDKVTISVPGFNHYDPYFMELCKNNKKDNKRKLEEVTEIINFKK